MTRARSKITTATPGAFTAGGTGRRLIAVAADDHQVSLSDHDQIDLTGLHNDNTKKPLMLIVQTRCNLGCWHDTDQMAIPCWAGS